MGEVENAAYDARMAGAAEQYSEYTAEDAYDEMYRAPYVPPAGDVWAAPLKGAI